ncbi:type II toxin-antitoxin system VapC family toxin [Candidatus Woesearchaeota archaeon]|nr:type II toxin-antitoxin system VapC family toxin [Candidatus Woesearchaeota archaeon]
MTVVVLDSNVLVGMFVKDDAHWERSARCLRRMASGEWQAVISTLAIPEVCGVIRRVTQQPELASAVLEKLSTWIAQGILQMEDLNSSRAESAAALAIACGISGADAVHAALAKDLQASLLTFDHEVIRKTKTDVSVLEINKI